jgi:hypothetical protein
MNVSKNNSVVKDMIRTARRAVIAAVIWTMATVLANRISGCTPLVPATAPAASGTTAQESDRVESVGFEGTLDTLP